VFAILAPLGFTVADEDDLRTGGTHGREKDELGMMKDEVQKGMKPET
jgi:hypothetical protein